MTDEEYLATRPEMTREEILERNTEFLGAYLFTILNPRATKWFDKEKARKLDIGLYKRCVELLYEHGHIDEASFFSLMELMSAPFTPETKDEAESKVREMLFPDVKESLTTQV